MDSPTISLGIGPKIRISHGCGFLRTILRLGGDAGEALAQRFAC
jgi:hypothetical protein